MRPPSDGKLRRQANVAEQRNKQQIDDQKGAAAVAAQLGGKTPDVGHADCGADSCENETPAVRKLLVG